MGGNAHENWALIRFLPLLIGSKVPHEEQAWQILTDLKDIVDLVVTPVHTEDSIPYLDFKISKHRVRFQEVFPDSTLRPKHHYLEHYPQLIRQFGPLVAVWTMRFESKHSFFKRVVRHTSCFKNVLQSLSMKHQFQIAYYLHVSSVPKPSLEVTDVSTLPLDVLNENIAQALKQKYVHIEEACLSKNVTYNGLNYKTGMILAHGSLAGLPEFCEIVQMVVVLDGLCFIVRKLKAWYFEHYRSFILEKSLNSEVLLVEPHELRHVYPLADYCVSGMHLTTVKRYIHG